MDIRITEIPQKVKPPSGKNWKPFERSQERIDLAHEVLNMLVPSMAASVELTSPAEVQNFRCLVLTLGKYFETPVKTEARGLTVTVWLKYPQTMQLKLL